MSMGLDAHNGPWLLLYPREYVAMFFLPLPEPIGLPDNYNVPEYESVSPELVDIFRESALDFHLEPIGPGSANVEPMILATSTDEVGEDFTEWFRIQTFRTSLLVHNIPGDPFRTTGFDAAVEAASLGTARADDTASEPHTPLEASPGEAEKESLSVSTVIEVIVPLRLLGELPTVSSQIIGESGELPPRPIDWPYVTFASEGDDEDLISTRVGFAMDVALDVIRSVQRAYVAISGHSITLLTRERLPALVPYVIRRFSDDAGPWNSETSNQRSGLAVARVSSRSLRIPPTTLPPDKVQQLVRTVGRAEEGAFSSFLDVRREAHVSLHANGDARLAVLLSGIAAEVLFDDLLLHLQWESGMTPEQAAEVWRDGLDSRVKSDFSPLIGGGAGAWDLNGNGPVADWSRKVADLRHRVAHSAYTPTHAEAEFSLTTLVELTNYMGDRLASNSVRNRYPRTAWTLLGEAGMKEKNAYTSKIRRIIEDPTEVSWFETFWRWREAHRRIRRSVQSRRTPDEANAAKVYVVSEDGRKWWCLHDHRTGQAAIAELLGDKPATLENVEMRSKGNPYSVQFTDVALQRTGDWVEEYHLIPLHSVMVDRSDLEPWPA